MPENTTDVNWKDLHTDEVTGFRAESPTVFFGKLGSDHAGTQYVAMGPGWPKQDLYIPYGDFQLLEWAINTSPDFLFDIYGDADIKARQWWEILDVADKLAGFETFDDVFDYLVGLNIPVYDDYRGKRNFFVDELNWYGVGFWEHRALFGPQLRDVRKWSELMLPEDGIMRVIGIDRSLEG